MSRGLAAGLITALLGLAIWQALIWIFAFPRFILPGPLDTAEALWVFRTRIAEDALVTVQEVILGLAIGLIMGVGTALQLASSPFARAHIQPILVFMQAVPIFALAPLLTIWFGFGMPPKIVVVVLVTYFPIASAMLDGLSQTPPGYLDLARTMGAPPTRVLLRVRLPAAVPSFCSGLRLAAVYAPMGAFLGEWVGAAKGLGALMVYANGRSKIDLMFAALIVFALITVVLHRVVDRVCDRLVRRYA